MSEERKPGPEKNAFDAVSSGFDSGITRSVDQRIDWLRKLEQTLNDRESDLLTALNADLGKPALEAWLAEFQFVREDICLHCKKAKSWSGKLRVPTPFHSWPGRSWTERRPFGKTLIFSPWNYPVQLSLSPLIGAISAGNTVVLKPSELAPASAEFLADLLADCFPPDVVQVVQGDGEVAAQLSQLPFDHFFYTGSERYGREVARAAAEQLVPCVLELGGKCPVVIGPGADLQMTAERIAAMKLFNLGQTCFAPDFVLVPQADQTEWVDCLQKTLREEWEKHSGDEFAHIVNRSHFDRLCSLKEGVESDPDRLQITPTAFAADWDSPTMKEEIFGPLLPVLTYNRKVPSELKRMSKPLASYFFSADDEWLREWIEEIPSGGTTINDVGKHTINHRLPFGGVGGSGYGRYRGKFTYDAFSYQRGFTKRYFVKDPFALKRPYAPVLKMMRRFMK